MSEKPEMSKASADKPACPVGAVFRLTLADLLRTRRVLLFVAVILLPVAFSLYWALAERFLGDALRLWTIIFVAAYLNFVIPFSALLFGSTLISAEHESQTLVYLLTRPAPRWLVALVKYAAAAAVCFAGVALSMLLSFALLGLHCSRGMMAEAFPYWLRLAGLGAAALLVYLAVFLFLGIVLRRPIVIGVVFIVIWEGLVGLIPGIIRFATVLHYLRSLAIYVTKEATIIALPGVITANEAPPGVAAAVLAVLWAGFLALSLWYFTRAEYPTGPDR